MENSARLDTTSSTRNADQASPVAAGSQDAQRLQWTLEQRLNERQQSAEQKDLPASSDRTGKRIFKALVGIAVVAIFGYLPVRALWQTSSVEAVVNSRLVTLRAPIDGQVVSATKPRLRAACRRSGNADSAHRQHPRGSRAVG
jgi:hypothetical protein